MSLKKKRASTDYDKEIKRKRIGHKGINMYIPIHNLKLSEDKEENVCFSENVCSNEKIYTQLEVTSLLSKQEQLFKSILEEKLREQFNIFNQLYVNNIFKEYKHSEFSYIN
jgi:hypothetical protein